METNQNEKPIEELDVDWLKNELEEVKGNSYDGEMKPAVVLEEGKVTELEIDFSKPFPKWEDIANNAVKKIIPVKHEGQDKVFFLNVKNPLYRQIVEAGRNGQTKFKVMRTGKQANTRYNIVKE